MGARTRLKTLGSSLLTSEALLNARRTMKRIGHTVAGSEPVLRLFVDFSNPYVPLAWQAARFIQRGYRVPVEPVLTGPAAGASQDPQRELKGPYFLKDAGRVAKYHAIAFAAGQLPSDSTARNALRIAIFAESLDRKSAAVSALLDRIWSRGEPLETEHDLRLLAIDAGLDPDAAVRAAADPSNDGRAAEGRALLEKLGHYETSMFELDGEWFWGIDRLDFLGERLKALGFSR